MDLKEYVHNKIWILHLIDSACQYSAACFVKSKNKHIVLEIYTNWIVYFGCPQEILNGNGREFSNETSKKKKNEKLGVETRTAGESAVEEK